MKELQLLNQSHNEDIKQYIKKIKELESTQPQSCVYTINKSEEISTEKR